jgi:hypothetical protein
MNKSKPFRLTFWACGIFTIAAGPCVLKAQQFYEGMNRYLAARSITCPESRLTPITAEAKIWGLLVLRLPDQANTLLQEVRKQLPVKEIPLFELPIAEMRSQQGKEEMDLLTSYLLKAPSSNGLYGIHLANLRSLATRTNAVIFGSASSKDLRRQYGDRVLVIHVSEKGLAQACSSEGFLRLVHESRVVAEFHRQTFWNVVIVISVNQVEDELKVEAPKRDGDPVFAITKYVNSKATQISPSDSLTIQKSVEQLIFQIWLSQLQ